MECPGYLSNLTTDICHKSIIFGEYVKNDHPFLFSIDVTKDILTLLMIILAMIFTIKKLRGNK